MGDSHKLSQPRSPEYSVVGGLELGHLELHVLGAVILQCAERDWLGCGGTAQLNPVYTR